MSFFEKALSRMKEALKKPRENEQSQFHRTAQLPRSASPVGPRCASPTNPAVSSESYSASHDEAVAAILQSDPVDLEALRKLCWGGCPLKHRSECWNLLTGYSPVTRALQEDLITRKRAEYQKHVTSSYASVSWEDVLQTEFDAAPRIETTIAISPEDIATMKQIRKDVPRTSSGLPLLQHRAIQDIIERVLYIWAVRHPACGYVQGMNDVLLPFLFVELADKVCPERGVVHLLSLTEEIWQAALDAISPSEWNIFEADLYWNASRLLEKLQEMYTFNQAGCHAMVQKLEHVMRIVDPHLCMHLDESNIFFAEFAFRWMNCLLLREFQPAQFVRLWDTYLSEADLASFHVYVCCALLHKWSHRIQHTPDMPHILQFLQNPPTSKFTDRDIDELTSSAFLFQQLYDRVPHHLHPNGSTP